METQKKRKRRLINYALFEHLVQGLPAAAGALKEQISLFLAKMQEIADSIYTHTDDEQLTQAVLKLKEDGVVWLIR